MKVPNQGSKGESKEPNSKALLPTLALTKKPGPQSHAPRCSFHMLNKVSTALIPPLVPFPLFLTSRSSHLRFFHGGVKGCDPAVHAGCCSTPRLSHSLWISTEGLPFPFPPEMLSLVNVREDLLIDSFTGPFHLSFDLPPHL